MGGRRTVIAWALTAGVLVVVFAGVFPRFAHYSQAWSSIQRMPAGFVAGLVVAAVVNIAAGAWQLQAALPGLGYRRAIVVDQTSWALSNAVPAGGPVAFGVDYDMLASYGFGAGAAAGASAISLVFNFFGTLVMPVIGVLALLAAGEVRWHYVLIAVVGGLLVGVSVAAMAAVLRSEAGARRVGRRLDHWVNALTRRLLHGRTFDIAGRVLDFRSDVVNILKRRWPVVIAVTLLTQLTSWAILLIALRGVEHGLPGHSGVTWPESLAAYSFPMIVWSLPITVGGLGTVDAGVTGLLTAFGMEGSHALAVDIVWRAATFVPQVLTGVLTFLWWRATAGRRRQAMASRAGEDPTKAR
jgi:uncharacterized membrane protein YbhN (UPF0104 family)